MLANREGGVSGAHALPLPVGGAPASGANVTKAALLACAPKVVKVLASLSVEVGGMKRSLVGGGGVVLRVAAAWVGPCGCLCGCLCEWCGRSSRPTKGTVGAVVGEMK